VDYQDFMKFLDEEVEGGDGPAVNPGDDTPVTRPKITAERREELREHGNMRDLRVTDTEQEWRDRFGLRSLSAVLECTPPAAMVDGILPQIGVCLLYGASGTAKTYAAVYLAWAVAGGSTHFLGQQIHHHGDVLYISSEDDTGVAARYRAMVLAYGPPRKDVFITNKLSPLDACTQAFCADDGTPSGYTALSPGVTSAILSQAGISPGLVIVDTFSTSFANLESENDNTQVAALIRQMEALSTELECPVLVLHHTGKNEEAGARGASAFKGNAFSILKSEKDQNGVFTIKSEKWKAGTPFEESLRVPLVRTEDDSLAEDEPQVTVVDLQRINAGPRPKYVKTTDEVDDDGIPTYLYEALDGAREKLGKGDYSAAEIKRKAGRAGASGALTTEVLKKWMNLRGLEVVGVGAKTRYVF